MESFLAQALTLVVWGHKRQKQTQRRKDSKSVRIREKLIFSFSIYFYYVLTLYIPVYSVFKIYLFWYIIIIKHT